MKILIKRALFLILSLCIFATLFSCGSSDDTKPSDEAQEIISTAEISFVNARAKPPLTSSGQTVKTKKGPAAVSIFKKYKELYGVAPKQLTDIDDGTDRRFLTF